MVYVEFQSICAWWGFSLSWKLFILLQTSLASFITNTCWSRPTNQRSANKKRWPDILQHVVWEQLSGSTWWVYDSVQQEHVWYCARWTPPGNCNSYYVSKCEFSYTLYSELISDFNQVPLLQPGTSASTLLPVVLSQNISPGPPSTLLQVAVKNSQQPAWYFNDKMSLLVFFTEDGRMERSTFLEVHSLLNVCLWSS